MAGSGRKADWQFYGSEVRKADVGTILTASVAQNVELIFAAPELAPPLGGPEGLELIEAKGVRVWLIDGWRYCRPF